MVFKDLSDYDLNLIKSLAINAFNTTRATRYEAIINETLGCIYAKGFVMEPYPESLISILSKELNPGVGYGSTKELTFVEIVERIFLMLDQRNIKISKDNREPTWSEPRPSWYTPYVNPKKPWVF